MDAYYPQVSIYEMPEHVLAEYSYKNYPLDYDWYKIIKMKEYPPGSDIKFVIVKTEAELTRYNAYGTHDEFNAYNLVKHYQPLKLIEAQIIFPEMQFSEENCGFTVMYIPPHLMEMPPY